MSLSVNSIDKWNETITGSTENTATQGDDSSLGVCVVIIFVLTVPLLIGFCYWEDRIAAARENSAITETKSEHPTEGRLDQIKRSLVQATVVAHNELCEQAQHVTIEGIAPVHISEQCNEITEDEDEDVYNSAVDVLDGTGSQSLSRNESFNLASNDEDTQECQKGAQECPICLEGVNVGDKVSWSLSSTCYHVFHYACIEKWMFKHAECPMCRQPFLNINKSEKGRLGNETKLEVCESSEMFDSENVSEVLSNPRFGFCIEHGILRFLEPSKKQCFGCSNGDVSSLDV